ncbi:MAG TPA: hypothetical protein VFE25_13680 [Opitutaceae bacterium]|nr:hypothetical protein [Opitutaceae bacterium]
MRDRILAVLVTLVVFATGFIGGLWAERHRPFPRPPGAFMGEFGARPGGPGGPPPHGPPINRAELRDQIEKIQPEMESFKNHMNEIYAEFDRDLEPILTADQKAIYEREFKSKRGFGPPPDMAGSDKPLSDEQIEQLMQRPFRTLAFFVVIPMTMERMTAVLKLDEGQRGKVKDLLRVRREKFIELVDSVPPPSLMLSRLAPVAQRLGPQDGPPPPPH